jgi:hypothetical protein
MAPSTRKTGGIFTSKLASRTLSLDNCLRFKSLDQTCEREQKHESYCAEQNMTRSVRHEPTIQSISFLEGAKDVDAMQEPKETYYFVAAGICILMATRVSQRRTGWIATVFTSRPRQCLCCRGQLEIQDGFVINKAKGYKAISKRKNQ